MSKKTILVFIVLFVVTTVTSLPWLKQQGLQMVDDTGKPFRIRGVVLGGWLEWEGWIFGGQAGLNLFGDEGYTSTTDILTALTNIAGASAANQFQIDVHNKMVTAADFAAMSSMGFNTVRVAFNHRLLMDLSQPYVWRQYGWTIFDNIVKWAEQNCIYVIFDLHGAPGGQALRFPYDPTWPLLWDSQARQNETVALWQAIAKRYANRSAVMGYDLLGEPWPTPNPEALASIYSRIISAIRQVDKRHIVMLEGSQDSRYFDWVTTPLDSNMVYSVHLYAWSRHNMTEDIINFSALARQQNVPVWVGEYGQETIQWDWKQVQMFENEPTICGYTYWTWKKVPDYFDHLVKIPASADWIILMNKVRELVANASVAPSIMSQSRALAAMQQFISALAYSPANVNWDMAQVLAGYNLPRKSCNGRAPPPLPECPTAGVKIFSESATSPEWKSQSYGYPNTFQIPSTALAHTGNHSAFLAPCSYNTISLTVGAGGTPVNVSSNPKLTFWVYANNTVSFNVRVGMWGTFSSVPLANYVPVPNVWTRVVLDAMLDFGLKPSASYSSIAFTDQSGASCSAIPNRIYLDDVVAVCPTAVYARPTPTLLRSEVTASSSSSSSSMSGAMIAVIVVAACVVTLALLAALLLVLWRRRSQNSAPGQRGHQQQDFTLMTTA